MNNQCPNAGSTSPCEKLPYLFERTVAYYQAQKEFKITWESLEKMADDTEIKCYAIRCPFCGSEMAVLFDIATRQRFLAFATCSNDKCTVVTDGCSAIEQVISAQNYKATGGDTPYPPQKPPCRPTYDNSLQTHTTTV